MLPTEVALEACAGAHHWDRVFGAMGHRVKPIPPQYVKPFVKRNKNDRNDAEAISETASRPSMRTVPVKTVDEQAAAIIMKHLEMLVGQRTQAINALRGHAAEFGIVPAKGCGNVSVLLAALANDPTIPAVAQSIFAQMGQHIVDLHTKIKTVNEKLIEQHKVNPVSQHGRRPGSAPLVDSADASPGSVYAPDPAGRSCR